MTNNHVASAAHLSCASCGQLLTGAYYVMIDRSESYCVACITTRPRCDSCGAPLTTQSWRLHDGRSQCAHCHHTAIYDPAVAQQLYDETMQAVISHLGLSLKVGVEFRLADAPTLQAVRRLSDDRPAEPGPPTLGLYQRQGHIRAIYILYGLPRLLFRITVAHEYAHAWQGEHCPLLQDHILREGFAEWVAYRHMLWLGAGRAANRMLQGNHPYRPMLEHVLKMEAELGTVGLFAYMRTAE
ncbi:MAG: protein DA1 [Chloroflexaceae bacterium]|nr:protein DA1 [Chloroflexaceae bacterium]NJL32950.1 protein DA1 [Chloroflexaceae bacterium]NJO07859.1 protein DA1 [Chloroflexaceae bacterium]